MKVTTIRKFANITGMITAVSIFGLVACNSDDYSSNKSGSKSADNSMSDTAATIGNSTVSSADNAGKDTMSTSASASTTPTSTASASANATPATKTGKRKGHASIMMPAGSNDASAKTEMVKDKEGVYSNVQVMPEFPGGQKALANYVNNHVEYPQQAIDDNTTGTVKVSFVVDENGKITSAHLINGSKVGKGLDEEALKVVNGMPSWKPGKVKGKNVKTRLELPISFQFDEA